MSRYGMSAQVKLHKVAHSYEDGQLRSVGTGLQVPASQQMVEPYFLEITER